MKYFLEQCLCSVRKAVQHLESEIIVYDNHSTDGSKAFFVDRFPEVRFIWGEENLGFARANNEALKQATGSYVLFLNPDTILPEDCLEKCIHFIHSKNDNCAAGVRMVDGSGKFLKESRRSFPGPLTSLYKLTGLAKLFPKSKRFAQYYLGHLPEKETCEVDVLAGAFLMLPRKILNGIGGFDESFFMYGEDIDLSYRIQKAGFQNFYFAETTILHFKGESTSKGSLNYVKIFYRAMSIFVSKHYGSSRAGIYNFFIQTGIALRALASSIKRVIQWIGLPMLDALLILVSFWLVRYFWGAYLRPAIDFDDKLLWVAFPAFSLLFLVASYYSGLYDNGFRQSRLNKSTMIAALVSFALYAVLPEGFRFSRGILLFSILIAYLLLTLIRLLFVSVHIIQRKRWNLPAHMAIVGSHDEYQDVMKLLIPLNKKEEVLGRVFVDDPDEQALGGLTDIDTLIRNTNLSGLIYCGGKMSYKQIIHGLENIQSGIRSGIFTPGCQAIIESNDKETSGEYYSNTEYFRLGNPLYRRAKRLLDVGVAIFILITFPLHLVLKKRPFALFKNFLLVLAARRTIVGYADGREHLPPLRTGLITTTGQQPGKTRIPIKALQNSDRLYAKHYSVFTDLGMVRRYYRYLS